MKPDVITAQFIPSDYSTFLYVLSGTVKVGEDRQILKQGETGWLDRHSIDGTSELILWSGSEGCRLVLYAGKPQDEEFVSEGPFIGDTHEDIKKVYTQYVLGKLTHIADVSTENKIDW